METVSGGEGKLRLARVEDASALLEIYAPYVTDTNISFEYEVPSQEEFSQRVKAISALHPYLTLMRPGRLISGAQS